MFTECLVSAKPFTHIISFNNNPKKQTFILSPFYIKCQSLDSHPESDLVLYLLQ